MKKSKLIRLGFPLMFISIMFLVVISVAASLPLHTSIQAIPNGGGSYVNQEEFPELKIRFQLLDKGKHFLGEVNKTDFILFEDNEEIESFTLNKKMFPVFVTTIVDIQSYSDLNAQEHEKIPAELMWNFAQINGGDYQLCFTQKNLPCKKYNSNESENFAIFYEKIRQNDILHERLQDPIPFQDTLKELIDETRGNEAKPIILIIRVLPADVPYIFPEIPENLIWEIENRHGKIIVVDTEQVPWGEYDDDVSQFQSVGVSYYSQKGVPVDTYSCENYESCIRQELDSMKVVEYEITFKSLLLQDQEEHQVFLKYVFEDASESDTLIIPFRLSPIREISHLKEWVNIANNIIVGILFPIGLISILIMVIGSVYINPDK